MTGLVLLHQGLDVTVPLELGEAGEARQRGGSRLVVLNRADRCALEWALAVTDSVTALTIGPAASAAPLVQALARGAARGIRIWDEVMAGADLAAASRVLSVAMEILAPDLVFAGERGLAGGTGTLPALVAARLGWPCLEAALRVTREPGGVAIERRLEGGRREEVAADCPAVLTVTADSSEPRYVSVGARRRAEALPLETWDLGRLGSTAEDARTWVRLHLERLDWPRPRPKRTAQAPRAGSASERMRQLLGGGRATASAQEATVRLVEGEPGQLADRILAFLESRGLM